MNDGEFKVLVGSRAYGLSNPGSDFDYRGVHIAKTEDFFKIGQHVKDAMDNYFSDLDGCDSSDLYDLVLSEIEKPLFEAVMQNTRGNISRASDLLGMNRGTLRTRLKKYGLDK